ncbi:MFS transporter [Streptomyces thioluteus]|uniref:MFS transporter n=1 Tax=Streptomyces thioluteus TaxID=66431 RepID=A0ABN3WIV2_STRTU
MLLMFGAALGDRFGRRRLFTLGLLVFTGASAAAALAPGIEGLIAARAVQGAGAAVMTPIGLTLLTAATPPERRGTAFGIWGAVNGLAVATGPLIGGGLTEHVSWHWIFWLNVPIGLLLLPLVRLRMDESRAPGARLDARGTLLVSTGLFGIVFAVVNVNAHGWTSGRVLTGLIAGGLLLGAFLWHCSAHENPMLPLRLFRNRAFSGINAAGLLMFFGMFGSIFLLSQFLQNVGGYAPTEAGLRMLPWTGTAMLVAPLAGYLADRVGGRIVVVCGLVLQAAGLTLYALTISADVPYAVQLPALIVGGTGMALYFAPASALVMSSVLPAEQGIASGANSALRELGGALGVAVLGSVFAARGGYGSPQRFVDGITPALWIGAAGVALAAVAAALAPPRAAAPAAPAPARDREPAGV